MTPADAVLFLPARPLSRSFRCCGFCWPVPFSQTGFRLHPGSSLETANCWPQGRGRNVPSCFSSVRPGRPGQHRMLIPSEFRPSPSRRQATSFPCWFPSVGICQRHRSAPRADAGTQAQPPAQDGALRTSSKRCSFSLRRTPSSRRCSKRVSSWLKPPVEQLRRLPEVDDMTRGLKEMKD
jgi:hypothetical protein